MGNANTGPIYGADLIDSLPIDSENPGGMLQAMPSHTDLIGVKDYRQGRRVVAGYEVLLNHWREQQSVIYQLNRVIDRLKSERKEGE